MSLEEKHGSYFHNWMSVVGGIFSAVLFAFILFLIILDFIYKEVNPYLGLVTYLTLPMFLVVSLLLIPIGAWRERARRRKAGYALKRFPQIDFNNPVHQRWAFVAWVVVTLFLLLSMFGAFRTYEFTESVTFCGSLCHEVMGPECTAYKNSPHAHVACVECHIGPGPEWYMRSKLTGVRQAYATLTNGYSRPIETPVKNLRPARETCEHCHWPQQFFGDKEKFRHYFLPDEANTEWKTRLLISVGGANPPYGKGEGIHWHMNVKNSVYYIALDKERQTIPWVKKISPDGKEEIYVDEESDFSAENPPQGEMRLMDCMDCHNRPAHHFKSPSEAVNEALSFDAIDRSLPFVKREAMKALEGEYASRTEARQKIRSQLENFYREKYPSVWSEKKKALDRSIEAVLEIYRTNFFPEMKASWKEYPDDIGHFNFPGCFRCHDGKHKTADGKMIRNDCDLCHSIIEQGNATLMQRAVRGLEFKHPEDIGDDWKQAFCNDCHTGGLA